MALNWPTVSVYSRIYKEKPVSLVTCPMLGSMGISQFVLWLQSAMNEIGLWSLFLLLFQSDDQCIIQIQPMTSTLSLWYGEMREEFAEHCKAVKFFPLSLFQGNRSHETLLHCQRKSITLLRWTKVWDIFTFIFYMRKHREAMWTLWNHRANY